MDVVATLALVAPKRAQRVGPGCSTDVPRVREFTPDSHTEHVIGAPEDQGRRKWCRRRAVSKFQSPTKEHNTGVSGDVRMPPPRVGPRWHQTDNRLSASRFNLCAGLAGPLTNPATIGRIHVDNPRPGPRQPVISLRVVQRGADRSAPPVRRRRTGIEVKLLARQKGIEAREQVRGRRPCVVRRRYRNRRPKRCSRVFGHESQASSERGADPLDHCQVAKFTAFDGRSSRRTDTGGCGDLSEAQATALTKCSKPFTKRISRRKRPTIDPMPKVGCDLDEHRSGASSRFSRKNGCAVVSSLFSDSALGQTCRQAKRTQRGAKAGFILAFLLHRAPKNEG